MNAGWLGSPEHGYVIKYDKNRTYVSLYMTKSKQLFRSTLTTVIKTETIVRINVSKTCIRLLWK